MNFINHTILRSFGSENSMDLVLIYKLQKIKDFSSTCSKPTAFNALTVLTIANDMKHIKFIGDNVWFACLN